MESAKRVEALRGELVGRAREFELVLAAVSGGRDLLLEGPPGTSKSTILRAITSNWGIPFLLVEGNSDLTPARLIGHHNPARVLTEDYSADNFVPGPLTIAMQQGGFLYIEEFNRTPDDTLNALLMAMAEREIAIPRVGRIAAMPTFRLVASMNPFDNVGTSRISISVYDRMCRLAIDYQPFDDELAIVALRTGTTAGTLGHDAVALARATRAHPEIRLGSSVRGAIDLVIVANELRKLRLDAPDYPSLLVDAALLAFSGRIHLHDSSDTKPETIIRQLVDHLLDGREPDDQTSSQEPLPVGPDDLVRRSETGRRPLTRKPKTLVEAPKLFRPGGGNSPFGLTTDRGKGAQDGTERGEAMVELTDDDAAELALVDILDEDVVDSEVIEMAQRIARALILRPPPTRRLTRGQRRLATVPYRYGSDEIDIDATLEILTDTPFPKETDIRVRERVGRRRAIALIDDVSGSMKGEKVRIAAATIGAVCTELHDDELAVVAFWSDVAVVQQITQRPSAERILRNLLRIPARGLTNLEFGLQTGLTELRKSTATERIGILLTDALHNAGPDPRDTASRFQRLHVLLEIDGEHDADLANDLARAGKGQVIPIRTHEDVPPALNRVLGY